LSSDRAATEAAAARGAAYWLAWGLLTLTTLFWAGNFVLGRAVSADIPPLALAWWRWALALLLILPFAAPGVWAARHRLRPNWRYLLLVSVLGVTNFNTFTYLGLQTLPATNAVILLSSAPVLILIFAWLIDARALVPRQFLGTLLSICGVLIIVAEGQMSGLGSVLGGGAGNLWVLLAVLSWALYSALLHRRPEGIGGLAFFAITAVLGWVVLTPFFLLEQAWLGRVMVWNLAALLSVAYLAVFASILAFLFWNRGVAILGPGRAGHTIHLIPVWGLVLAALLLEERLLGYHWAGIIAIVTGIALATVGRLGLPPSPNTVTLNPAERAESIASDRDRG